MEHIDEVAKDVPFTVWKMFYVPTMALFNELEESSHSFESLLDTILTSTGDFSEYLVPRPGMPETVNVYYKAFNSWLIGRLFYIWSVKELNRIHIRSKDAQLKILMILNIHKAKFYNELHKEYILVLNKLIDYCKENISSSELKPKTLENFTPHEVSIPDINLRAKYVCVANIENGENLIKLILQLLSESIPLDAMVMLQNEYYDETFIKILYVLETQHMNMKLPTIKFFSSLIFNYDRVATTKFCITFPKVVETLMSCIEALISCMHVYHEAEAVKDSSYLETLNSAIVKLLKVTEYYTESNCQDTILNICSVVLTSNISRLFSNELKLYCLTLSRYLRLPEKITVMSNLNASEINALSVYYAQQILDYLKSGQSSNLKENFYCDQINSVIKCLETCAVKDVDQFLIIYHIERCKAALNILINSSIKYKEWLQRNKNKVPDTELLAKENATLIWYNLTKLLEIHKHIVINDLKCSTAILDILLATILLVDHLTQDELNVILRLSCMQAVAPFTEHSLDYTEELKLAILKHLLVQNMFLKGRISETRNKIIHHFLMKFDKSKLHIANAQVLSLGPWLLLNKNYSQSKFIAELLMPALHTKDKTIQKQLCEFILPIACMALSSYVVILTSISVGHVIFCNDSVNICLVCTKCHNSKQNLNEKELNEKFSKENIVLHTENSSFTNVSKTRIVGQRSLLAKFLNPKLFCDIATCGFLNLVQYFSNHTIFDGKITSDVFTEMPTWMILKIIRLFGNNITDDNDLDDNQKEEILNSCIKILGLSTKKCLLSNDQNEQRYTLDCIYEFGLCKDDKVLLPSTKLLVYFIMHPQCFLSAKAVVYLREICESHECTLHQTYYKYEDHYGKVFIVCGLYNGNDFINAFLKVLAAFGLVNYKDFIAKEIGTFLPYLIAYSGRIDVAPIIQEFATLTETRVTVLLSKIFPRVYTYLYLYESDETANKCYELIEKITGSTISSLIRSNFRVVLTELLLQYCCNPEKVLNGCRYLATQDPDLSNCSSNTNMSISELADFLQPKFLGVLACFHTKLVCNKGALSGKRKALQSFPDIMNLMGAKHVTPLRFKILASLRSALSLAKEYPKILASAWSAFVHNIDTILLGPFLATLAVSLLELFDYTPHEVNKILQYLVLSNENLLSAHIPDLFFLEESKISEDLKLVIKRHVKRTQPNGFLDKIKWYLQRLHQDIPNVKAYAFNCLNGHLKDNRAEIDLAIFGGKNIDPTMVELIDCLLLGCKDSEPLVSFASGSCLGQLGAIESGHLPRQYVQSDRSPFAFSISDDCFAATALTELTRAFQYEKYTEHMDYYAFTIQEMLKIYNISPTGSKNEIWNTLPENMQQVIKPLLNSRYTLLTPQQTKKPHPIFGSSYGTSFLKWAHNWTGTLISLIDSESIKELLCIVYPSMRRDLKTLLLFLPYVLLHTLMSKNDIRCVQEEIVAVLGSFENNFGVTVEKSKYKIIRDIRVTINSTFSHEDCSQIKCCQMVYNLLDFLNRWLVEWFNTKQNPLQNENYKTIKAFLNNFDKLTIIRGNVMCGEFERALQYLELYMEECKDKMQDQLPLLAEIYALLDEPDSVAGILSIKRSEPSLKEMILAQVVTGRLQDAALCYERLAQEGLLDKNSMQGMVDCYLGLDQPYTAYQLLSSYGTDSDSMTELAAESLWRLGDFEQLEEIVKKPVSPSRENWGLIMGRILLSFRSQNHEDFETSCKDGMRKLLAKIEGEGKNESVLHSGYQSVLGLHIIKEATLAEEVLLRLKSLPSDDTQEGSMIVNDLLEEWRLRLSIVQSDVRTVEPVLRCQRILLQQMQKTLQPRHPNTVAALKTHIGNLWLESAKHARKAGNIQQANMYILNAEQYHPEELFIEKAKIYWARGLQDQAFTTLKRALDESYPDVNLLSNDQRKICAKAKLLNAKYNDVTTSVDADVNISYYKEAVGAFTGWEKSLVCLGAYYEKMSGGDGASVNSSMRINALNSYGKALLYGHKYLYQSMPRMLSIWLDMPVDLTDVNYKAIVAQMTGMIRSFSERLPVYLYLPAFSQIVSRICHPVLEATTVSNLVRALPRLLERENFSHIMMPFQEFCKVVLPSKAARRERVDFDIPSEPTVYIAGIEEQVQILMSLQRPRKVALRGSDGKKYFIMLKPKDDLRKDFRLMEFNGVVNRFLQDAPETRSRRLYIRTYNVLPLNEECGLIEWVPNMIGLRPILNHIYKQKGIHTSNRQLKELMCSYKDTLTKKLRIFEEELLPRHPPVFQEWFKNVFTDPYGWYQARSAYIRTTAVISMVGYILGLGDRHGENILFDQTNGDTMHVDFSCLFNKGETFEWAERVPFRLTHNMEAAMGPLRREGMFRKSCEAVMRVLRAQTAALMSVVGPFVYDPLLAWGRHTGRAVLMDGGERTNEQALQHIKHIRQRLNGMVRTKNKQLSLSLSPEGQVKELIEEATSVHNLCQMYIGWGPYL